MSRMSVEWHKECLANNEEFVRRMKAEAAELADRVARSDRDLQFYREQVAEADRRAIAEFDRERFLVKRKPKGETT